MSEASLIQRLASLDGVAGRRVLVLVAAGKEAASVCGALGVEPPGGVWERVPLGAWGELVRTGVGVSNAAGAAGRFLDPARHAGVVSVGVAGALPGSGLGIGDVVIGTSAIFGDVGLMGPGGFSDQASMGFPAAEGVEGSQDWGASMPLDAAWSEAIAAWATARVQRGRVVSGAIATVSVCSGTDELASAIARRTGGVAEAMEGAGIALVAARLGLPCGELRGISNTTGDRERQVWDLARGLAGLSEAMRGA